jgi:hypothetical protein
MPARWLPGGVGRVAEVGGQLGGMNFQAFNTTGGELAVPASGVMDGPGKILVPALVFEGPCVLIYITGADAEQFRKISGLPPVGAIVPPGGPS